MSNDQPDARQERIDATARAVLASYFFEGRAPVHIASECDYCYTVAIALEAARERRCLMARVRAKEGK